MIFCWSNLRLEEWILERRLQDGAGVLSGTGQHPGGGSDLQGQDPASTLQGTVTVQLWK